jgi:hypothetical protein
VKAGGLGKKIGIREEDRGRKTEDGGQKADNGKEERGKR